MIVTAKPTAINFVGKYIPIVCEFYRFINNKYIIYTLY